MNPACPVCGSSAELVWRRTAEEIRNELNSFIHPITDPALIGRDYAMHRCGTCTLIFADPLVPGDGAFYDWLASCSWYYPESRWEFSATAELLRARRASTVLEVGCGYGAFLEYMNSLAGFRTIGLDLSPRAVDHCRQMGLNTYLCDVADFTPAYQKQLSPIDAVVSFHCLEHLSDPVGFLRAMWEIVAPGGAVYVSTPYSPLHYERRRADPLNCPPHHMSRWNARSYEYLAKAVSLEHRILMPKADTVFSRFQRSISKWDRSVQHTRSPKATLLHAAIHPIQTTAELLHQMRRERVKDSVAADVILVEFSKLAKC